MYTRIMHIIMQQCIQSSIPRTNPLSVARLARGLWCLYPLSSLSIHPSIHTYIHTYISIHTFISRHTHPYASIRTFIYPYVHTDISTNTYIYASIHLSNHICIHPSIYPATYQSIPSFIHALPVAFISRYPHPYASIRSYISLYGLSSIFETISQNFPRKLELSSPQYHKNSK